MVDQAKIEIISALRYFLDFYQDFNLNRLHSLFMKFLGESKLDERLQNPSFDEKSAEREIEDFLRENLHQILPPLTLTGLKIDLKNSNINESPSWKFVSKIMIKKIDAK